ncbi:hypothetical protein evm_013752 [Chilo suppressalis]|nr:hypothetical protein evm_013752 [Chilo suppressalis]
MSSNKVCCVPGCTFSTENKEVLHKFPNPAIDKERFNTWVYSIGGKILGLTNDHIFKYRRVCRKHFEDKFWCRNNFLSNIAIPTKFMPGLLSQFSTFTERRALTSIQNIPEASTSKGLMPSMLHLGSVAPQTPTQSIMEVAECRRKSEFDTTTTAMGVNDLHSLSQNIERKNEQENRMTVSKIIRKRRVFSEVEKMLHKKLLQIGVKLSKCRSKNKKQAIKIKAMQNIVSHPHLSSALDSWPSTARILTTMQFREQKKNVKGRRFSLKEKILALSIFKQSPKGYRFFRKIFILPSPQTLTKLISMADIKPGVNKRVMTQIKKATQNMKIEDRLCLVIYDEMALKAHVSYSERKDRVTGFVTDGKAVQPEFADHAQVFMIRGLIKNYKEPVSYTFSQAATKGPELAVQLKEVICNLQEAGLIVVATVCDQGTNNMHCIKLLMQETRATLLRKGEEQKGNFF